MRAPADRWAGGVWGLVLLVGAGGAVAAPAALEAGPSADQAIAELLEENPRLSELVRRDHTLLEVLGDNPAMTARLATKPALLDRVVTALSSPWVAFGFAAQFVFAMRFIVQWIASERRRRSYVPVAFWYLSICGGLMLLTYAIQRRDPVFMAGQSLGVFIYVRNLVLIYRRAGDYRDITADRSAAATVGEAADASPAEPSTAG
jgi:lipid-A-disaccharide synthase-like uncharacterized protein